MMFRIKKQRFVLLCIVLSLLASVTAPSSAFKYLGCKWPKEGLPVVWEMKYITGDCTGSLLAAWEGYQTWEDVSCSYFTQSYKEGTEHEPNTRDGVNVVSWDYPQSDPEHYPDWGYAIATTCIWYNPYTGEIAECDIVFDDALDWSSTGEAGKYDIQNIATHEFGHSLGLDDLYGSEDTEKTMYGYAEVGETKKRTLHQDDIDGICYIYPKPENQPPNTPSPPTGPDAGTPDTSYSFTASTTDPDEDQVAFKFNWGDGNQSGWTSYVDSGSSASKSHSWSTKGTYYVKVRAKDTYNAESGWSAGHAITIRAVVLEVDPSFLDFDEVGKGSSKTMTFRAYNAGGGTLSGTVSDNRNWITVSPTSFESNDNTISVTVETDGLTEKLTPYTGTVTVTSNGGTKTVEVSVIVIPTGAVVYPNPFSLSRHTNLTFWGTSIPGTRVQIFTLGGELVKTLFERYGASNLSWDGRNEKGNKVVRGIYIYIAKDSRGKIAIVK